MLLLPTSTYVQLRSESPSNKDTSAWLGSTTILIELLWKRSPDAVKFVVPSIGSCGINVIAVEPLASCT